jgi:hypothetical protein
VNFATYQAFKVNLQWLIESDQLEGTFNPNLYDLIISLGEQRVYADLRASTMLAPLSLTTAGNTATLPADLLELHALYDDPNVPIEVISADRLQSIGPETGGRSLYASQTGDVLTFWPSAPATVTGYYYQRPPDLKTALSTTFQRYPDVFLFAALVESGSVTGESRRIPEWDAKYKTAVGNANRLERERAYGGSRIRIRAR